MSMLSLSPAIYYAGDTITTADWKDSAATNKRMIRTDVALDNTVVITDSGFSWGDTDMKLSIPYRLDWYQTLQVWLQAWPELVVCRFDGVYLVVLQSVKHSSGRLLLQLAVTERIN